MINFKPGRVNRDTIINIRAVGPNTERGIRHAFFRLGQDLKNEVNREILKKPKHGRVYIVRGPSGRRRRHVASAPGETHANLTGATRKSIGWKVRGYKQLEFGYLNNPPKQAPYLEFGTGKMKKRPSLSNGLRTITRNGEVIIENEIIRNVR